MDLLTFLRVIVLVTNGVYCFVPRGDMESSATKAITLPIQPQIAQANDISVYDPGVGADRLGEDIFNSEVEGDVADDFTVNGNNLDVSRMLENLREEIKFDESIAMKSAMLLRLLEATSTKSPLPVLYVEGEVDDPVDDDLPMNKRSGRYYRRYPWKRQNTRSRTYESESRYLCVPSREDVFKLLVGLHENRNGNNHKTVHFCNRKRPAKAIFTNIRFLG
ncbi:uncharacterized protein LOC129570234 isoform X2 [Sitodiplosis mosellana]|uniref:uncharacterized protein LOC129570234 isoform X2 n=1 Tax=Sitodiplosis mosellana TaxID=263140 RepID=UPI002444E0E7|nr:uncharacterized protein LOC129570234 isoform X2 [Sitodiplosis mosellana]